jgi:hypothetical protein
MSRGTTGLSLANVTSSGRSRSQGFFCIIPFILNVQNGQVYTVRKQISGLGDGIGAAVSGERLLSMTEF